LIGLTDKVRGVDGIGRLGVAKTGLPRMAQRIADEREHRRGLVLGLTLAEVLLLLLFLLLLALGRQMDYWRATAQEVQQKYDELGATMETMRPLQQALAKADGGIDTVSELIQRLSRVQQMERTVAQLQAENSALGSQVTVIRNLGAEGKKLSAMTSAYEHAMKIDPSDPPAVLKRALDVIDRLGTGTTPEQVKPLAEMTADFDIKQSFASVEADRDKIRRERDNLMRSGNGLTYPSCWTAANGQTEYMFEITTKDAGLIVKDAAPPSRVNDPAWKYVDAIQKASVINERTFDSATNKLFAYGKQQNCRFYSILRDDTGRESKERYKQLRSLVENHFYVMIPRSASLASQRRELTPEEHLPTESVPKSGITLGVPWLNGN
jgi:hypothetical protein